MVKTSKCGDLAQTLFLRALILQVRWLGTEPNEFQWKSHLEGHNPDQTHYRAGCSEKGVLIISVVDNAMHEKESGHAN